MNFLRRKADFVAHILRKTGQPIYFADVGSGGPLKTPWNLIPPALMSKIDIEPTQPEGVPICVSNVEGEADFYIAEDERGSSLHQPLDTFIARFPGQASVRTARTIKVKCLTLDTLLGERGNSIDVMDVNVEGHDQQTLEGSRKILANTWVKLIKVEFETAPVWKGQGWLGGIESLLRNSGFELKDIEIEFARPGSVAGLRHKGEPLWGKAYYVSSSERSARFLRAIAQPGLQRAHVVKAVVLYVLCDLLGAAFDAIDLGAACGAIQKNEADGLRESIGTIYRQPLWKRMAGRLLVAGRALTRD